MYENLFFLYICSIYIILYSQNKYMHEYIPAGKIVSLLECSLFFYYISIDLKFL